VTVNQTWARSAGEVERALRVWLWQRLGADVQLTVHGGPSGAGNSSDTVLFDANSESFALRVAPLRTSFPLFPRYDLARQAAAMQLVRERSAVPVPRVVWFESDESVFGGPFFVMERIPGMPVPDNPPYVFGSWLTEASVDEQREVEDGLVDILAGIHAVPATSADLAMFEYDLPGETALERHFAHERAYYEWILREAGTRFPVIDEAFAWLEARWPTAESDPVLIWGDARPANVLFRDCKPVAVLDWEKAAVGPRELDVAWNIFFHQYFQRVAERYGYPGLPAFMEPARFADAYASASGHEPENLDWHLAYAELCQALTSIRVSMRAVELGQRERPEDPQDLIIDRQHFEESFST
jgi:aminoglycoside phosphotransferase (APT) family kinase protein